MEKHTQVVRGNNQIRNLIMTMMKVGGNGEGKSGKSKNLHQILERREWILLIENEGGKRGFVGNRVCLYSLIPIQTKHKQSVEDRWSSSFDRRLSSHSGRCIEEERIGCHAIGEEGIIIVSSFPRLFPHTHSFIHQQPGRQERMDVKIKSR